MCFTRHELSQPKEIHHVTLKNRQDTSLVQAVDGGHETNMNHQCPSYMYLQALQEYMYHLGETNCIQHVDV